MAPVCGATGVLGSAVGSKGGWVGGALRHRASAAGEIAPLVSVMSGQSLSVSGLKLGMQLQVKGQIPSCAGPSGPVPMMEGHHKTFTTKSLHKLAIQPHYLNNMLS